MSAVTSSSRIQKEEKNVTGMFLPSLLKLLRFFLLSLLILQFSNFSSQLLTFLSVFLWWDKGTRFSCIVTAGMTIVVSVGSISCQPLNKINSFSTHTDLWLFGRFGSKYSLKKQNKKRQPINVLYRIWNLTRKKGKKKRWHITANTNILKFLSVHVIEGKVQ